MTLISGVCLLRLVGGTAPIEILTGGSMPPYSINLRMDLAEAVFAFCVNLIALLGARNFVRETYGTTLLYLLIVMGIQARPGSSDDRARTTPAE
jgi:formate hydrogenlyase subunit 3/multisubunit Na+/H+ antiporter MnhD subunit